MTVTVLVRNTVDEIMEVELAGTETPVELIQSMIDAGCLRAAPRCGPANYVVAFYKGHLLADELSLTQNGVTDGATLRVTTLGRGC